MNLLRLLRGTGVDDLHRRLRSVAYSHHLLRHGPLSELVNDPLLRRTTRGLLVDLLNGAQWLRCLLPTALWIWHNRRGTSLLELYADGTSTALLDLLWLRRSSTSTRTQGSDQMRRCAALVLGLPLLAVRHRPFVRTEELQTL